MANKDPNNPVVLQEFVQYSDAMVLESLLKSAGIHAATLEQNQGMIPVSNTQFGGIRVVVAQKDLEDGFAIARSMEASRFNCTVCGSSDTASMPSDGGSKKGCFAFLALITSVLLMESDAPGKGSASSVARNSSKLTMVK